MKLPICPGIDKAAQTANDRVRFYYCSARDDGDQTPTAPRGGRRSIAAAVVRPRPGDVRRHRSDAHRPRSARPRHEHPRLPQTRRRQCATRRHFGGLGGGAAAPRAQTFQIKRRGRTAEDRAPFQRSALRSDQISEHARCSAKAHRGRTECALFYRLPNGVASCAGRGERSSTGPRRLRAS